MLEICVDSVESAINAEKGGLFMHLFDFLFLFIINGQLLFLTNLGADRLELCSSLALGGLTPSIGMKQIFTFRKFSDGFLADFFIICRFIKGC